MTKRAINDNINVLKKEMKMIRFILSMLFIGAFLAFFVIAVLCVCMGFTVKESINWILNRVEQTQSVVVSTVKEASKTVEKISNE